MREVIIPKNHLMDEADVDRVEEAEVKTVLIRSALTCESQNGICGACYGRDLARGTTINMGEAVGVIAAQSIGEPGTQLTMRTFHIGGTAQVVDSSYLEASYEGTIRIRNSNISKDSEGRNIVTGRSVAIVIEDEKGVERASHRVNYGARILVAEGDKIQQSQRMAEWDPYTRPMMTEIDGTVEFEDVVDGLSVQENADEATGITKRVVVDWRTNPRGADLKPAIVIKDKNGEVAKLKRGGEARILLSVDAILSVEPGAKVKAGDVMARIPTESAKTKDITGGLPRVAELFEARRPKDHAVIATIDGTIRYGRDYKNKRRISIEPDDSTLEPAEYLIPKGKPLEQMDRIEMDILNERMIDEGKKPASGNPVLLGITKASLQTRSFISAAWLVNQIHSKV